MPLSASGFIVFSGTLRRGRRDRDLEEELRLHIEMAAEDAHRRGAPPRAAARTAQIRAGRRAAGHGRPARSARPAVARRAGAGSSPWAADAAADSVLHSCGDSDAGARDRRQHRHLSTARRDPPPHPAGEGSRTSSSSCSWPTAQRSRGRRASIYPALTNPLWEYVRDHQEIFSGVLAWSNTEFRLGRSAGPRVARGLFVSGDFFTVLGVGAHAGRTLHRRRRPAGLRRAGRGGQPRLLAAIPRRRSGGVGRTLVTEFTIRRSDRRCAARLLGRRGWTCLRHRRSDLLAGGARRRADWLTNGTVWWLTVMGRMAAGQSLELVNRQLDSASTGLFEASLPANYPRGPRQGLSEFQAPRGSRRRGRVGAAAPLRRSVADSPADHRPRAASLRARIWRTSSSREPLRVSASSPSAWPSAAPAFVSFGSSWSRTR